MFTVAQATPTDQGSFNEDGLLTGVQPVESEQHEVDGPDMRAPISADVEMPDAVDPTLLRSLDSSDPNTDHAIRSFNGQGADYDGDHSSVESPYGEPDFYTSVDGDSEYNADEESVSSVVKNILARVRRRLPTSRSASFSSTESDIVFVLHRREEDEEKRANNAVPLGATHEGIEESQTNRGDDPQPPPVWPEHCLGCHEDADSEFELRLRPVQWKPGSRPTRRKRGGDKEREEAATEAVASGGAPRKAPRFTPCVNKTLHDPARFQFCRTRLAEDEHDIAPGHGASSAHSAQPPPTLQSSFHSLSEQDTPLDKELQSARDNAAQRVDAQPSIDDYFWNTASFPLSGSNLPVVQPSFMSSSRSLQEVGVIDVPAHDIPSDPRDWELEPTQDLEGTQAFLPSEATAGQAPSRVLNVPHYHLAKDHRDANLAATQMVGSPGSFEPFGESRFLSKDGHCSINARPDATATARPSVLQGTGYLRNLIATEDSTAAQVKHKRIGSRIIEVPAHSQLRHPQDEHLEDTQVADSIYCANLDADK